jgi:hypothetical protein
MKNRKTWIITGTIGILAAGSGAAFASQPSTTGDNDAALTTVSDNATRPAQTPGTNTDDDAHGMTLTTPDPKATTTVAPTVAHADPAQPMPDSTITSLTLVSAPSAASTLSPASAPSPVSALSPVSAPSAPSAD